MQQYFLSPCVYLCLTDDHVVLLDLKRDKYIGLGRARTHALAPLVKGWPASGDSTAPDPKGTDRLVGKMLDDGLLTGDPAAGKDATPVTLEQPTTTLVHESLESSPKILIRHALDFLTASVRASLALRWRPIEQVVRHVQARKERQAPHSAKNSDLEAARELVSTFVYLRPLLFGARDRCLFDSLALIDYLSGHGIFPTWVFGVQTGPFAAHCWVQHGSTVFNDTPEHVRRYTPILTI